MQFKPAFIEKYSKLTDFEAYKKAVATFPRKSLRVNTLKISVKKLLPLLEKQGWMFEQVPWCAEGFYIDHQEKRRDIGRMQEHEQGYFFVQKSVSMIPSLALDPQPGEKVLDLCAAPGGKTTHLAALMKNTGTIIANENDAYRINALKINLERCGVTNTTITKRSVFDVQDASFDRILLDAPCSGSGLIKGETQRSKNTLKIWNKNYIKGMSKVQKRMILHAYSLLRKGGTLVYSTCSLEPEENEQVVDHLLAREGKLEQIDLPVKAQNKKYLRIWPQDNNTEGFFVAKIRKENNGV
ncbi:MAG: RsmB/NOP family class I SAM-dependent RNA methyltransferase [Nanoarchaeota archaeon]